MSKTRCFSEVNRKQVEILLTCLKYLVFDTNNSRIFPLSLLSTSGRKQDFSILLREIISRKQLVFRYLLVLSGIVSMKKVRASVIVKNMTFKGDLYNKAYIDTSWLTTSCK